MSTITRVEVIDHRRTSAAQGRMLVLRDVLAEISMQDDGRTLKVFVTDGSATLNIGVPEGVA